MQIITALAKPRGVLALKKDVWAQRTGHWGVACSACVLQPVLYYYKSK